MTIATNLCKGVIKHCGFKQSSRGLAVQSNRWTNCTNMENYNADQVKLMKEECIAVDEHDCVVGPKSKLACHLQSENLPLHRAFSLFLFNSKQELLMQQRASSKITFPGHFTNSCCSHPLYNQKELNERDAMGVKLAAQRRLFSELGVNKSQFPVDCITYLTRIHYKASSDDKWGEHEVDYILFAQCDVNLDINPNEVSKICYVPRNGMQDFLNDCDRKGIPLTPWFKLIVKHGLMEWWSHLDNLRKYCDHTNIVRLRGT
ncbi:isopentenyl-diphosphate Delta-isomerase 1-like [Clavelina lepadiformis]